MEVFISITQHFCDHCVLMLLATTQVTPATQTIRVQPPGGTTILKASPQTSQGLAQTLTAQGGAQKQIITVQKGGQVTSQPQIVTLVKTTQGMTVAQVRMCIDPCADRSRRVEGREIALEKGNWLSELTLFCSL